MVTRSVAQAGSKRTLSPMTRATISNRVVGTTTTLTTLAETHLCSLIGECTTIPSVHKAWMSCMAKRTPREGLGLIAVRHISLSATLQNGSGSRAPSPRPLKEERNSRKDSKDNEKTKFTTLFLRPHHLACSCMAMYQSHPMLSFVFFAHNPPYFAFICC